MTFDWPELLEVIGKSALDCDADMHWTAVFDVACCAAATELRRQREASAAEEPAGLAAKLDAAVERQWADNTLRHAAAVYGNNDQPAPAADLRRQQEEGAAEERPYSEARARREDATQGNGEKAQDRSADRYGVTTTAGQSAAAEHDTPSPASSAPAADREGVAKELHHAHDEGTRLRRLWESLTDTERYGYGYEADYVLQREAKLRKDHESDLLAVNIAHLEHSDVLLHRATSAEDERDHLRTRMETLTAEVEGMRSVVEAAHEWCSKWDRNAAALGDAVHEYERARLKAQESK